MSKPRLTNDDYCRAANTLGCEVAAIKAVANQESLGSGFDSQDRPKILFERHKFHKLTRGVYDHSNPGISNAVQGGYGRGDQYVRFSEAFALNPTAAMMAASWGKFQILGSNFAICGFLTVDAFVDAMKTGEGPQLDAFCEFVLHNYLDDELTSHDWAGFARGYNGPTYRKNKYDVKIGAAYKQFAREKVDCAQIPATTAANDGNPILPTPSNTVDQSDPNSTITADTANPDTAPDLSGDGGEITDPPGTQIDTTTNINTGLLDKAGIIGDKFASFRGVLEKFGFADDGWVMSLGTKVFAWAKMASGNAMMFLGVLTGHWELILAGVILLIVAAWIWNEARKRNLLAKSGVPVEVIKEVAQAT